MCRRTECIDLFEIANKTIPISIKATIAFLIILCVLIFVALQGLLGFFDRQNLFCVPKILIESCFRNKVILKFFQFRIQLIAISIELRKHRYKGVGQRKALIIVNMGTATTLSVINEKKQYIGGMIIPGIKISTASLTRETAQLPKIGLEKPKKVIGTNTIECMKSGIIYGTAASIDGCIQRIEKEYGGPMETIVATCANIKQILPYCEREMCLDETLLFQGLKLIYEKNQKS